MIGYDNSNQVLDTMIKLAWSLSKENFPLITGSQQLQFTSAKHALALVSLLMNWN